MNLKISSKEDEEKAKSSFVITVAAEYFHAWNCIFRSSIIIYFKYKKEFLSKKGRKKKCFPSSAVSLLMLICLYLAA